MKPTAISARKPTITRSSVLCPRRSPIRRMIIATMAVMIAPSTSGRSKSRLRAMAPPTTSARSVAIAMASACSQYAMRGVVGNRWPMCPERDRPVTMPSLAERYCTSTAMTLAMTTTHTSV